MTMDDTPLFRHQDELEHDFETSPTGGLPSHERRQEDESLGAGVMGAGGTATDTGLGTHAEPDASVEPEFSLPGFGPRDQQAGNIGQAWARDELEGDADRDR